MTMTQPDRPSKWLELHDFTLGDRMRKTLDVQGQTVAGAAEYLGVTRGTVGNWLNDRIRPSRQTLLLWADLNGVSMQWLETGIWTEEEIERAARLKAESAPSEDEADFDEVRPKGFEPPTF
ncbi:helix-turn-helix domain-containing protein [Plantibacter sp. YIM 135347]|uniref:helix-turn-helix domain-containing protein n=1 Tax=Plantibacter sp. YIM 135347 TaxID=3423919 RepID=UPI003D343D6D